MELCLIAISTEWCVQMPHNLSNVFSNRWQNIYISFCCSWELLLLALSKYASSAISFCQPQSSFSLSLFWSLCLSLCFVKTTLSSISCVQCALCKCIGKNYFINEWGWGLSGFCVSLVTCNTHSRWTTFFHSLHFICVHNALNLT